MDTYITRRQRVAFLLLVRNGPHILSLVRGEPILVVITSGRRQLQSPCPLQISIPGSDQNHHPLICKNRCGFCSAKEFELHSSSLQAEKKEKKNIMSQLPSSFEVRHCSTLQASFCTTVIFSWFSHFSSQSIVTAGLQGEWVGPEVSCDHSFLHCTSAPSHWEGSYTGCSFYFHSYSVPSSSLWCLLPSLSFLLCFDSLLLQAQVRSCCDELPQSNILLVTGICSGGWQRTAVGRQYAPLCLFRFIPSWDLQGHPSWPEMSNHSLKLAADKLWQGSTPQTLRAAACIDVLPKGLCLH